VCVCEPQLYKEDLNLQVTYLKNIYYCGLLLLFFPFGATAPIVALAYLHETPFHFGLIDLRHSVGLLGRVINSSQGLYGRPHTGMRQDM
jgi:hypothetical protein